MPRGIKVRYVKFTPEEMAYEAPADVSDPKRFPTRDVWECFCKWRKNVAVLEPRVRALYPSDAELNKALLKLAEAASHVGAGR